METSIYYRNMLVYDMPSVYDISDFEGFVDPPPLAQWGKSKYSLQKLIKNLRSVLILVS